MADRRRPKPASPARIDANRRNALKSTGPKTDEGKAKASLNNLKHGLRAETVVLPGEDAEAFQARLDGWLARFGGSDPARAVVVERAVLASWRLERCARAEKGWRLRRRFMRRLWRTRMS